MKNQAQETYDTVTGRVEGVEEIFTDSPATDESATPNEENLDAYKTTEESTSERNETTEGVEKTSNEPGTNYSDSTTSEPDRLYAGKFKTIDELKIAYQNLGGDPSRFTNTKELEEAYEYRNTEYLRLMQEKAERERVERELAARELQSKDPNQIVDEMLNRINWDEVTDAKTLTKQLLPILLENVKGSQQHQLTEEEIVERIIPIIKDREQKAEALHAIEMEVPRLVTDPVFRRQFALHVVGGQKNGLPYPRTKEGLRQAMKDFLEFNRSIVEEISKQKEINNQMKLNAQATPDTGGSAMEGNREKDEADEIIREFAEKQKKFNLY